jgi:ParB-like chromosome segregation protein Spo0J
MSKGFKVTAAALAMRELRKLPPQSAAGKPGFLPLTAITVLEAVFQPRAMSEHHVHGLSKIIKKQGSVAPVLVWPAGDQIILLDGHHRLEAYKKSEKTDAIPVEYFEGTADAALAKSGECNTPLKLVMNNDERQNFAWRMVTLGDYTKDRVAVASGVGLTQVDRMRAVKLKLGNLALCFATWKAANKHAKEPEEERGSEDWKERQAEEHAEKLTKAFGNKLSTNAELAAMALQIYFGRKLPDLYHQIGELMSEDEHQQAAEEGRDDF